MRTPEEIIGADALLQLTFEGYEVVPVDRLLVEVPDGFAIFWAAYPRHTAKPAALRAYKGALKRTKHDEIMAGVRRLVASKPDPQFTPHPATWLNQDRWNDTSVAATLKGIDARRENLRGRIEDEQRGMERAGGADPRYVGRISYDRR